MYLKFCDLTKLPPTPATSQNLCRYAAFLARSRAPSTIRQYMNIIRIISLQFGLPGPLDSWELKSMLTGVRRGKGDRSVQKEPITIQQLSKFHMCLNTSRIEDCQFWAACLVGFFGLLRVSNFTISNKGQSSLSFNRQDISFNEQGCLLSIKSSKTNQFRSRNHEVALPYFPNSELCPTSALSRFLAVTREVPATCPIFSIKDRSGNILHLTQEKFRRKLLQVASDSGLSTTSYNTHSLRRGGATWLLTQGTPLAMVKAIGDWASDSVFTYIKPTADMKYKALSNAFRR